MKSRQLVRRMKQIVRSATNLIIKCVPEMAAQRIYVIPIEGGLGSQILCYINYLEKLSKNRKLKCDLEYFEISNKKKSENLSYWGWELDSYGISKESVESNSKKLTKWQRIIFEEKQPDTISFLNEWSIKKRDFYRTIFPVDEAETTRLRVGILGDVSEEFALIHIRRGDYIFAASHLVPVDVYAKFLQQQRGEIPGQIIISSDSELGAIEKERISQSVHGSTVHFLNPKTYSAKSIHDLMRSANQLICANSTFSFSAGLLASESTKVYFPVIFQNENKGARGNPFLAVSDFALMRSF
jgi:hypothetical protein